MIRLLKLFLRLVLEALILRNVSMWHVPAQDYRRIEFSSLVYFEDTKQQGFELFLEWIFQLKKEKAMEKVIVGREPTGHYWLNLACIYIFCRSEPVKCKEITHQSRTM